MTQDNTPPQKILAVVDDSDTQIALRSAAALAERHGAAFEVFGCVEPPHDIDVLARLAGRDTSKLLESMRANKRDEIQTHLATHLPGHNVPVRLAVGKTFIEVIRHVIDNGCDFVVKSAEPLTGVHRLFFASTDQHLLRKCPCPVWLQTSKAASVPKRVLATVDVDDWDSTEPETLLSLNRRVLDTARRIAAPSDAEIVVLHAWEAVGEGLVRTFSSKTDTRAAADAYVNEVLNARQQAMNTLLRDVMKDQSVATDVTLVPRLVRGSPEHVIEEQSRACAADVVVMGTVARTGLRGVFIGNTAENIINSLECSVLAVKPNGFVSPLEA